MDSETKIFDKTISFNNLYERVNGLPRYALISVNYSESSIIPFSGRKKEESIEECTQEVELNPYSAAMFLKKHFSEDVNISSLRAKHEIYAGRETETLFLKNAFEITSQKIRNSARRRGVIKIVKTARLEWKVKII